MMMSATVARIISFINNIIIQKGFFKIPHTAWVLIIIFNPSRTDVIAECIKLQTRRRGLFAVVWRDGADCTSIYISILIYVYLYRHPQNSYLSVNGVITSRPELPIYSQVYTDVVLVCRMQQSSRSRSHENLSWENHSNACTFMQPAGRLGKYLNS